MLASGRGKSFRLASDSTEAKSVEHYTEMGLDYLQLAHEAAKLAVPAPQAAAKVVEAAMTTKPIAYLVPGSEVPGKIGSK